MMLRKFVLNNWFLVKEFFMKPKSGGGGVGKKSSPVLK